MAFRGVDGFFVLPNIVSAEITTKCTDESAITITFVGGEKREIRFDAEGRAIKLAQQTLEEIKNAVEAVTK